MHTILLRQVILDDKPCDVLIAGNRFASIAAELPRQADEIIDCQRKFALTPAFYNTHTHIPMSLLRGLADDYELQTWLNQHIWPAEAKLTYEDVYAGSRLSVLEMLKSGTVLANDNYMFQESIVRACDEMGIRCAQGYFVMTINPESERKNAEDFRRLQAFTPSLSSRYLKSCCPHSIYTVNEEKLRWCVNYARENNAYIHIHASETQFEVQQCQEQHNGLTPIEYLNSLGILGPRTILAHCTHLTDHDIALLAESQSIIAHCPVSNMKLCSGLFRWDDAWNAGCRITIATDGCASNNNQSMLDEMKFAAMSAKVQSRKPTAGSAAQVFAAATCNGAQAFNLDAGIIAVGKLADCLLVDLENCQMVSNHNLISNLVYSADSSVIDTVICDGKILMRGRKVPGEEEILDAARKASSHLKS